MKGQHRHYFGFFLSLSAEPLTDTVCGWCDSDSGGFGFGALSSLDIWVSYERFNISTKIGFRQNFCA